MFTSPLIPVIHETLALCRDNPALARAVEASIASQRIIPEAEALPVPAPRYAEPAQITVSARRSFEAAAAHRGHHVAVLNFASATQPGGGVMKGSRAQEESLCRCSTLYPCLQDPRAAAGFYQPHRRKRNPLHNDDCILTPGVVVMRSDDAQMRVLSPEEWQQVDVISCAAPNLRQNPSNAMNPGDGDRPALITPEELYALHVKRLRRILTVAALSSADTVILGAFGCGAFSNDPAVVAPAMAQAAAEFRHVFRHIEFAVYCRSHEDRNHRAFCQAMQGL